MCHWEPETLSLVQLNLACEQALCSQAKLNFATLQQTKVPKSPISQSSCFPETTEVTSTVQPKKTNLIFLDFEWQFPVSPVQTEILNQLISFLEMIPYSGPKLSDLYTLSQSKLLENHTLHSSTHLHRPYTAVTPPPRDPVGMGTTRTRTHPFF